MNRYVITDFGVLPNIDTLQTEAIQRVLDLCREGGGTVVIPKGYYCVAALRMWSDTTLYLEAGAQLLGSEECTDYEVFPVPEGVELRTDMELITQYYLDKPWPEYRRAMISAYGEKNIAIIGEGEDSVIDGRDCFDPDGEEGFRGPHGVFFTNCEGVVMKNYTIQRNGNFMHQLDNCRNILMENVTCLAGHDGIHLHHCTNTLIQNCRFITGDDCVAGINIKDLTVKNCEINTSCQAFRIGGHNILVEDCHIYGPGYYPHRKTVVQGRGVELPRTEGRHNIHALVYHFASTNFPSEIPYGNYVFRNCLVETVDRLMLYTADGGPLESGAYLSDMTFENVTFKGMLWPAQCVPSAKVPLTVTLKNCTVDFREESKDCGYSLFAEGTENLRVVIEQ